MAATALREKQSTATRDHLLGAALELLVEHPDRPFSHEAVAKAAGVGARTVYRYFPAQCDLYEALWAQVREQSGTVFPTEEAEIVPSIGVLYRAFDQNEKLVRAVMESPAGARVRARGAEEGRTSFDKSLQEVTQGRSPVELRQVRAVFHGIHSGPFWQMLRDRGGLSGPEAIAAASWAAQALLDTLRREQKSFSSQPTGKKKKGG
ncbi:MAG: TetR family transcriptional regulator [Planctomycetes bacterium]|nr:TetR family transcriptional regulator [Planctomycetota bacterium]